MNEEIELTECPVCLGKKYIDEHDIKRFNRESEWHPGPCVHCEVYPAMSNTGSFVEYENCFFCGQPIRNPIMRTTPELTEFQLPYCSETCIAGDADADQIIATTKQENFNLRAKLELQNKAIQQDLLDPAKKSAMEEKTKKEEEEYKSFRSGILWVLFGAAVVLLILSNLDDPFIQRVFARRLAIFLGVAGIGALISRLRSR